jgi:hypothetical protein
LELKRRFVLSILIFAAVGSSACNQVINNPAPVLTSISPTTVQAGSPSFTLTLTGKQFVPNNSGAGSTVEFNGLPRATFFVNTNTLTSTILAADVQSPGEAAITVVTSQPGGGTTASVILSISPTTSPTPQISSISPAAVFAGSVGVGSQFTLVVNGAGFVPQSIVTANGSDLTPVSVSSTSLQVGIPGSDIAVSGVVNIAVVNPPPGGGSSNTVKLAVNNPVPTITALTPAAVGAGATTPPTLTVTGSSFAAASVILINGAPRQTTFANSTSVSTPLSAGDLAAGGAIQIQVQNPAPGGGTSNILPFFIDPSPTVGLPVLVDVGTDGSQANLGICGACAPGGVPDLTTAGPSTSSTGEFVAYASISTNLVVNDQNPGSNIFVRNTCLVTTGNTTTTCAPVNELASVAANNGPANGSSSEPSVSTDGTLVAFTSLASNLVTTVPIVPPGRQVFLNKPCTTSGTVCTTTTPLTQLISVSADGSEAGNHDSFNPAISPDGRYVAFVSLATNLVSGVAFDGVNPQVFLRDTCGTFPTSTTTTTGCTPTTFLVSTPNGTTPANGPSSNPSVANDALFVSFTSSATNLGQTADNPSGAPEVFERGTCVTGIGGCATFTNLISTPDGTTAADGASGESSITIDGRFVAFASTATILIPGVGPTQQIYVRDTCTGQTTTACTPSTTLVSTPNGTTPGNALSEHPSISLTTGQFIAFASFSSNLSGKAANGIENIFTRNTCTNFPTTGTATCSPSVSLVSVATGTSAAASNGDSLVPSISADGHVASFISLANDLVARDSNSIPDIFLGTTTF